MINSTENLSLDQIFIRGGRLLQRSLHDALANVVSNGVPDSTQARVTSISTAQWTIKNPSVTPLTLPESLEFYLPQAFNAAPRTNEHLGAVLDALSTLLPHVSWVNRQAQADQDDSFVERHRHGLITGPGGLFECSSLTLGLTLMAPDTCYPFHHHPPAEFYLVLSPGQWYQEDVGWWSPGAGGVVFNPPSCIQA
ncbi:dimethylsulfonioproprionate lyase family protein [Pseudomonas syringae]|uniref:dimethylsulfonioproprionate lyase family protein n=1 Tax=Pseudomonas syringae TaxID=317 RepID=UPI003F764D2C